jgi:hypothetical protein
MRKHGHGTRRASDRPRRIGFHPRVDGLERRVLLTSQSIPPLIVTSTADKPPDPSTPNDPLTLRQAIIDANASPGPVTISFNLLPTNAPGATPGEGNFDLTNQVWTIDVDSPLPALTSPYPITIDGYTQSYVTPVDNPNVFQKVAITGSPTGGTFTLTFEGDTTGPIAFDATAAEVQTALAALPNIPPGTVEATLGPVNTTGVLIDFYGAAPAPIQLLTGVSNLVGSSGSATPPAVTISPVSADITAVPNAEAVGFDAQVRVILEGENPITNEPSEFPGLTIDSNHNLIRGLAIDGFSTGINIQGTGNQIQGNYLGQYLEFPNPSINTAPAVDAGIGNGVGIEIASPTNPLPSNDSVGGVSPDTHNAISGNLAQGVVIDTGANDNQVVGNLIGILEEATTDTFQAGNGAEGVLIESASNVIGGDVAGATNVISANFTDGIHIEGALAQDNRVDANYIGTNVAGGFVFGSYNPGNGQAGILIDDAPDNQIGLPGGAVGVGNVAGNIISLNGGAGVSITGVSATGNIIQGNLIGADISGASALGNSVQGVELDSSDNTVGGTATGDGNLISGNLRGVLISGSAATGNLVAGNSIGTDGTGTYVLGNSLDGVDIAGASDNTIGGLVAGARNLISGNEIGVLITMIAGTSATDNLVVGNYIGTNATGLLVLDNEDEGVRIEKGASDNTIGGTSPAAINVISGNGWGVTITDPDTTGNVVQGNFIGVGADGATPLGNEIDGVLVTNYASDNTIGGTAAGQGNTIAFNLATGVIVQSGTGDSILSNSIYSNGRLGIVLGIVLGVTSNNGQSAPVLSPVIIAGGAVGVVQGSLNSVPNTSFLIQFFSSITPDPSGSGQGQTFIGSTTVMTGANGSATIDFTLPSDVTPGEWITATATNQTTGDTSAFSNAIQSTPPPSPVSVAFSTATYMVESTAGSVEIEVVRTGDMGVAVSVNYATSDGSAVGGQDYLAEASTLTFPPNVSEETFLVPILVNDGRSTPSSFFNVTLSQPTGGATLGAFSSAIVTIINENVSHRSPPAVTGVRLIKNRQHIVEGIVVSFSEPLNPTTAVNLLNYNYSVTTAGRNHVFGTRDNLLIPFTTAVYDTSNLTVTLRLGRGIHPPTPFRFAINQLTDVAGAGVGVANLAGVLLSGADNSVPGGAYVVILRGNPGGIVRVTSAAAVTRKTPRSDAAVDAVLEAGKITGTGLARAAHGRRVRAIDRRR